jgi:2-desacetyl-2-hydroxyethyl bacteriochlorophyllide A dehydrogenase
MGHELAVEVVSASEGAFLKPGDICTVNPYLSCGRCIACRQGKTNCCVSLSVLGVHQDGGMTGLLAIPFQKLISAEGLTVDACATVEFLAIGAHAVRRAAVDHRDHVLVVGAGPIGLGVALFARQSGARVVVLDRDEERAKTARSISGAEFIVANGNAREAVKQSSDGEGFEVVFDATGNRHAMEESFAYVAHGGRYVLVGVVKDQISFSDPDFHRKELTLFASRNATKEDFDVVIASIRAGKIPIERLITHRTSLRNAVSNLPLWATQKTGLIKAIIEID